jgi:phage baseplate assembly protein W
MPLPYNTFRIDPRDLNKTAIGVSLPFNGPAVFNSTYSTKDQVRNNLINLMLTNKGERIENPEFGSDVRRFLFEFITSENLENLRVLIINSIETFIPEINITNIVITPDEDLNTVTLKIEYQLKLSGTADQVTIAFE